MLHKVELEDLLRNHFGTASTTLAGDTQFADNQGVLVFDEPRFGSMRKKITALIGDSATFDFEPFRDSVDFVFIDAGHSFQDIENDTKHAESTIRRDAVVVWHDYELQMSGVFRYLNERAKDHELFHVLGTSLVSICPV